MYSQTGRIEERAPAALPVRIASLEHPTLVESAITKDISSRGLRVAVKHKWLVDEPVLVESPPGRLRSRGWVVHCQSVSGGKFEIGLRLLVAQPDWQPKDGKHA